VTGEGLIDCHDDGVDGVRGAALQLLARQFAESVPDQVRTHHASVMSSGIGKHV